MFHDLKLMQGILCNQILINITSIYIYTYIYIYIEREREREREREITIKVNKAKNPSQNGSRSRFEGTCLAAIPSALCQAW